jgi:hypothetical protein
VPWNHFSARNFCRICFLLGGPRAQVHLLPLVGSWPMRCRSRLHFFLSAKSAPPIRCAARACLGRLRQFWILPSVLFSQLVFASVFVRFRVPEYQAVDVAGGILGSLRFCSSFFISSCATGALLNSGLIPGVVLEKAKFFLVLFVFMW